MNHNQQQFLQDAMREDRGLLRGIHVTGESASDFAACQDMAAAGYMKRLGTPAFLRAEDVVFQVTPAGRSAIATTGAAA